jgi:hypothetical protein
MLYLRSLLYLMPKHQGNPMATVDYIEIVKTVALVAIVLVFLFYCLIKPMWAYYGSFIMWRLGFTSPPTDYHGYHQYLAYSVKKSGDQLIYFTGEAEGAPDNEFVLNTLTEILLGCSYKESGEKAEAYRSLARRVRGRRDRLRHS